MDAITIKGTNEGLFLIVRQGAAADEAIGSLRQRLSQGASFFQGARVKVLYAVEEDKPVADALRGLLNEYGVDAVSEEMAKPKREALPIAAPASKPVQAAPRAEPAEAHDPDTRLCKVITGTLRSGQRISFSGDIVLVGDCNPGCELVAGGNIFIMGMLRGSAHAGAMGDQSAMVCAFHLKPTNLRIAGVRANISAGNAPKYPEMANLKNGSIVISAYLPNRANK